MKEFINRKQIKKEKGSQERKDLRKKNTKTVDGAHK